MKTELPPELERGRILHGEYASKVGDLHGMFSVVAKSRRLRVVSSGPDFKHGWEHVSVSCHDRTPTWREMCLVKSLFWGEDEMAVQYHPAKKDYVNYHPHCLHLWKPIDSVIPCPPSHLVGPKT
jgi:hypothetical protein